MNSTNKIYSNAKVINCKLDNNIIIGENSFVRNTILEKYTQINRSNIIESTNIGAYSYTGMNTVIKHASIGKFCSISWGVSISGGIHNYNLISPHPFIHLKSFGLVESGEEIEKKKIIIGNDVWIGANATILPGIEIGNGAIIGAGSVVTKNVPDYAIAVGNPANVIKYRFCDEKIKLLKELCWWELPENIIKENIELFKHDFDLNDLKNLIKIKNAMTE